MYFEMQRATTEEEFQRLLAEHDKLTDAEHLPRFALRTLAEMKAGAHDGQGFMSNLPERGA